MPETTRKIVGKHGNHRIFKSIQNSDVLKCPIRLPKRPEKPKNLYFYGIFCYSYSWILMKIFK